MKVLYYLIAAVAGYLVGDDLIFPRLVAVTVGSVLVVIALLWWGGRYSSSVAKFIGYGGVFNLVMWLVYCFYH